MNGRFQVNGRPLERSGKPASAAALEAILGIAGERSADVQQLAHETWSMTRNTPVAASAVGRALLQIIDASESLAIALLDKSTQLQQRALFAVALYQDQPLSQRELVRIIRFRSASSLRKALEPFLSGELPILEQAGTGRVRFRHRYLRLWFVLVRDLVRVRDVCRTILGVTADIHDYDGLRRLPEFRRRVGGDLVRVF